MDVSQLREEYTKGELSRDSMANDPAEQFRIWFEQARTTEVAEPNAMVLASVDSSGQPFTRTVLLKEFDAEGLVFYTNFESRKSEHFKANAKVSALFLWLPLERQVSINGTVEKVSSAQALKYFLSRPLGSRLGAWVSPQSSVIRSRSILDAKLKEMQARFKDGQVPLPSFWGGYRIRPETWEFWQGRRSRLHDRFLYSKADGGWNIERLAP